MLFLVEESPMQHSYRCPACDLSTESLVRQVEHILVQHSELAVRTIYRCPVVSCDQAHQSLLEYLQHVMQAHIRVPPGKSVEEQREALFTARVRISPALRERVKEPLEERSSEAASTPEAVQKEEEEEQATRKVKATEAAEGSPAAKRRALALDPNQSLECTACHTKLSSRKSLKRHYLSLHKIVLTVKCSLCPAEVANQVELVQHHKREHAEDTGRCEYCCQSFKNVKKHQRIVHNVYVTRPSVPINVKVKQEAEPALMPPQQEEKPVRVKSEPEAVVTPPQPAQKQKEEPVRVKSEPQSPEQKVPRCSICAKVFQRSKALKEHQREVHSVELDSDTRQMLCVFCRAPFAGLAEVKQHQLQRHMDMFRCSICQKVMTGNKGLRKHVRKVHNNNNNNKEPPEEGKEEKAL